MPDWRVELEALLSQLDVTLDRGMATEHQGQAGSPAFADSLALEEVDTDIPWELGALATEETPVEGEEVSAVRSEIEATVQRVIAMTQAGQLEPSLRDDIVFVLQALTRPRPSKGARRSNAGSPDDSSQEWQLASAAAVLHFCRIVLRLAQALAPDGS
jgi:hypothetical protein